MKRWIIHIALMLFLLMNLQKVQAQQPVFSQFYTAGLYLNPALAGMEHDITVGMNYRTQWAAIDIPYSTFQTSYIHPLMEPGGRPKHVGGIGASVVSDVTGAAGEFRQYGFNMAGAYNYHLNRYGNNIISFGLQAGLYEKKIDPSALQWSSQYDVLTGYDGSSPASGYENAGQQVFPVLNAGVVWTLVRKDRFSRREFSTYQGLSFSNLNRPNESVYSGEDSHLPLTIRAHGGLNIFLNKVFSVSPHYLVQWDEDYIQTNLGAYLTYYLNDRISENRTVITAGGWYRVRDAMIGSLGVEFSSLRLGFSYDRNVSSLGRYFGNAGSYEISLYYRIKRSFQVKRYSTPMI